MAFLVRYGLYGWIEDLDACWKHLYKVVDSDGAIQLLLLCLNGDESSIEVQVAAQLIKACRSSIDIGILNNVVCTATEALDSYESSYYGDELALWIARLRILLGKALVMKYLSEGEIIELNRASHCLQQQGITCMGDAPLASVSLTALQHIEWLRFVECGDLEAFLQFSDYWMKETDADKEGQSLYEIGTALIEQAEDLQEGIALLSASLNCRVGLHPRRSVGLNALANAFITHFQKVGNYEQLEDAITLHQEALNLRRPSHPDRSSSLNNLASSLSIRFEHKGAFEDLEKSITLHREALDLLRSPHPNRSSSLNNLGHSLYCRFRHKGAFGDLEECIILHREALDLRRPPHPDRPMSLTNLANSLSSRFQQKGGFEDLEECITLHREALNLCQPPHPNCSSSLSNLAISLFFRFEHKGASEDLEECIMLHREALGLRRPPHPDHSTSLNSLATSLSFRFEHKGAFEDLQECITLHRESLDLHRPPHPSRSSSLNNLANSLYFRFKQKGGFEDLEECITLHRESLDLRRPPHPDRSMSLNNLAGSLSLRFEHKGAFEDLEECIKLHREALDILRPPHPDRSGSLNNLASSLSFRFEHKGAFSDIETALQYFQEATKYSTGLLLSRLAFSKNWVMCAEKHCPALTLDAFICSMELLPQLASLDLTVQQRQDILQHSRDLAGKAAKCAIGAGQFELAITFLSTGRSIFWSQALQLRTPVDELMIANSVIAERFITVSRRLENASYCRNVSALSSSTVPGTSEYLSLYKLATQRQEIIEAIRRIPGYEDFLLPHSFESLQSAAKERHIIFLSASELGCDALVMHGAKYPVHIPLLDIHLKELEDLKILIHNLLSSGMRLIKISQDVVDTLRKWLGRDMVLEDLADSSEEIFRLALESLWCKVVRPVVNTLWIKKTDSPPRIWWCPTGPFSSLPIHASGVYSAENEPLDCLFQYAVSSYITSPQDLLHSPPQNIQFFKMTAIIEPGADNAGPLPFTLKELERISMHIPHQSLIARVGSNRTPNHIRDIISSIQQSSFVHFGCHGMQSVQDPLESCLLLSGGRLTVSRLMKECRVPEGALAYLSACETAKGDEIRPDESLNLVATMMFTGFRSVVGTLWSILDCDAPIVADVFYGHLFRNGKETPPDVTDAAYGLHLATKNQMCGPSLRAAGPSSFPFFKGKEPAALVVFRSTKHHLILFRNVNIVGQVQATRSRTLIDNVSRQVDFSVEKYRRARISLASLGGDLTTYPPLLDEDLTLDSWLDEDCVAVHKLASIAQRRVKKAVSSGRRTLSWIWTAGGGPDTSEEGLLESVRIEWSKAKARCDRWYEEVTLLREEMRRVLRYLCTVTSQWEALAKSSLALGDPVALGRGAYAARQAFVYGTMAARFQAMWSSPFSN